MRIVCISSAKVPSDTANSIEVMKVCQAFVQLGHEVRLLVPGPRQAEAEPDKLRDHYGLQVPLNIEWLPPCTRRIFPWNAAKRARRLHAELLYTWPVQSAVLGLLLGMPTMLELHDRPTGTFGPIWFRMFRILPGRKRILPITKALQSALNLPAEQVQVAPDGVDLERYQDLPQPGAAREMLGLSQAPTALCSGHLYEGRGVNLFLLLAARFPKVRFVWAGGRGADVDRWKNTAEAKQLPNALFTGFIPNKLIPIYQSAAEVLLMPYEHSVSTSSGGNTASICSPMKMFEYMAAGRAILTSDLPVLREVLDSSTAVFCPAGDILAWETALQDLLADDSKRAALGRTAREKVKYFSWIERSKRILQDF